MTHEEWAKENHDFILHFLTETEENQEDLTLSIKATICQFLQNTRYGLYLCSKKNGGEWVSRKQVIEVQIEQLRRCIDRKSTRLNSSHSDRSRMPSSA